VVAGPAVAGPVVAGPVVAGPVRFVVLGGSAPATVQLIDALADWPAEPGHDRPAAVDLVLHGRSPERLNAVASAATLRAGALGLAVTVTAETDRPAALTGADIVLNQIRPGGLEQRSADESFPREFGIPGEETMGPGGLACAVRAVSALRPVWADVAGRCPGALLINLTNPAGIVTQAARLEFGLDVVSVCDSPLDLLAEAAVRLGCDDSSGAGLRARYVGMNHVGWYVPESDAELDRLAGMVVGLDPDLPRLHGALPGSYLRYYAHPDRMLAAQRGRPTRADELRALASSTLQTFGRGELPAAWQRPAPWYSLAVVPLARAWRHGSAQPLILGLPNGVRVPWLPADVIVEGPAQIARAGTIEPLPGEPLPGEPLPGKPLPGEPLPIEPLPIVSLPDLPRGILARHASYERLAAVTLADGPPSDDQLIRVLLANPLVTSLDQARGLAGAIADRMSAYDPAWR
jgi:6-phospho-beta-glucosidase